MLKWETVSARLKSTLVALMRVRLLNEHRLVGGTALSLQIGHRYSVDIDLFYDKKQTDYNELHRELFNTFGSEYRVVSKMDTGIRCEINNIKVDMIDWDERWIRDVVFEEGIRLVSKEDIIALKLNTLCSDLNMLHPMRPRYDKKDFVDIAVLSHEFSVENFISFYRLKYPTSNIDARVLIERLGKFDMAEKSEMPEMLSSLTWNETKDRLHKAIVEYIQQSE